MVYNNTSGTGNPVFAYQIRNAIPTNPTQSNLPTSINDIYMQSGGSALGDFPAVVPIGANNPNGIRRVEIRNADNTLNYALTSADGTWPNGTNTTNIVRREVKNINNFYSLQLTALLEGSYNDSTNVKVSDTAKVYLRSATSPYLVVDSAAAVLNTSGTATFIFKNISNGIPYYIDLRHRNSIETWSASPQSFMNTSLNYDFSTSLSQAFGNNIIQVDASPLRFAIYSGDANQDGTVDVTDVVNVYNDALNFVSGYVTTDITGDNFVDVADLVITYNNSINFVSVVRP